MYLRRARLVLKSKLNGCNKIKSINTLAVSLRRYEGGRIVWKKDELLSYTRKLMIMNTELKPQSDVSRLYLRSKDDERGVISIELYS